jgi:hypothetical protein
MRLETPEKQTFTSQRHTTQKRIEDEMQHLQIGLQRARRGVRQVLRQTSDGRVRGESGYLF